jgi:EAL domain-containing protein (putative c-di-GMP-specific phosphodiesterase class I)
MDGARLTTRLRRFIDGAGLEAHLQPIVDLTSGRVVGAEALARFDDGAPPFTWFGQAARAGLAVDLERPAMRAALAHLPNLPEDVYLSLNASPGAVLAGAVHDVLDGSPASRIVIEITEHAAIEDYAEVADVLEPLLDRGARLAIDDAGAGFANFRHVLLLTPDYIKLDVSLTRGIHQDPSQRALAEALVAFAHQTKASVIAEGIQSYEELRALTDVGVTYGQGYLLSPPLPLNHIRYRSTYGRSVIQNAV